MTRGEETQQRKFVAVVITGILREIVVNIYWSEKGEKNCSSGFNCYTKRDTTKTEEEVIGVLTYKQEWG